jgi:RNA polymerase sigma-70 factor (ECF subfamily)
MYLSMSEPTESKSQSTESIEIRTVEGMTDYFESVRLRLEKIVRFRMDPIFRARMDVSDVLQEGYIEALRRFDHWPQDGSISLFIWLRQRVLQALWDMQRLHSRDKRSVQRERSLPESFSPDSTSLSLANYLADDLTSPSQVAVKGEDRRGLYAALEKMSQMDREVLALRHFEYLTNQEAAEALNLSPTAASNRYVRATMRLSQILQSENPSAQDSTPEGA